MLWAFGLDTLTIVASPIPHKLARKVRVALARRVPTGIPRTLHFLALCYVCTFFFIPNVARLEARSTLAGRPVFRVLRVRVPGTGCPFAATFPFRVTPPRECSLISTLALTIWPSMSVLWTRNRHTRTPGVPVPKVRCRPLKATLALTILHTALFALETGHHAIPLAGWSFTTFCVASKKAAGRGLEFIMLGAGRNKTPVIGAADELSVAPHVLPVVWLPPNFQASVVTARPGMAAAVPLPARSSSVAQRMMVSRFVHGNVGETDAVGMDVW